MFTLPIIQKCVMYITRGNRLLVFDHVDAPEAGTQVPAGTLRYGESPEIAALREAREETGLMQLRMDGLLGERILDLRPYGKAQIHRRFFYHLICEEDEVQDRWLHHESDPGEGGPPIPFAVYWVDLKADALPELAAEQGDLLADLMAKLGI